MGRLFVEYLGEGRKYACKECLAGCTGGHSVVHLAAVSDLLSKSFHSRSGPAYLFTKAINVTLGSPEERDMTTGRHVVRDLYCISCGTNLGWRYELAHERREKYKEGKYILERLQLVDLEAASNINYTLNGHTTTSIRLVNPPPPPLISLSGTVTTAIVPGNVGASPTGVTAMMMMPDSPAATLSNASPRSSLGGSPLILGGVSPPPPPPPPPRPQTQTQAESQNDNPSVIRFGRLGSLTYRSQEREDMETEVPGLRAFFSNWAPAPAMEAAVVGGETGAADVGASPAAITDPPPHFNIDL